MVNKDYHKHSEILFPVPDYGMDIVSNCIEFYQGGYPANLCNVNLHLTHNVVTIDCYKREKTALAWSYDTNASPAHTTASSELGRFGNSREDQIVQDKLGRHSEERLTNIGTHLGGCSSQQTRLSSSEAKRIQMDTEYIIHGQGHIAMNSQTRMS